MTIEQLLELPTKNLEGLSDEQLLDYFGPYLEVSRPKVKLEDSKKELEEGEEESSKTMIDLSGEKEKRSYAKKPKKTKEQQFLEMLKQQEFMAATLGIELNELPKGIK